MNLKVSLLSVAFMLLGVCSYAQPEEINEPVNEHFTINCEVDLPNTGCNMIPNAAFNYSNSPLAAFSRGDVSSWQDVNSMTTDINGELGAPLGWFVPTPPADLTVNYSSMLADNLNKTTEGIAAKFVKLEEGNKYLLSFFLATSDLPGYRTETGTFNFKIILGHCQNFSLETTGNPTISGETQLIYCRDFTETANSDWQQYIVTFEAAGNFDMIIIYPEVGEDSYDGGNYIHFGIPELIPINPTATYFEANGGNDGLTTLTACGVTNGLYEWNGPNGFVTNDLSYGFSHTGGESADDDYSFTMWVPNAIGNLLENCVDASAPEIRESALETTNSFAVDCLQSVSVPQCNLILNSKFLTTTPTPTIDAFRLNNVNFWSSFSGATPDINGVNLIIPPPLPSPFTNNNSAGIAIQRFSPTGPNWVEGISSKIAPVTATKEYAFSFFLASSIGSSLPTGADFTFKVVLTKCAVFPMYPHGIGSEQAPLMIDKQEIFCQPMDGLTNSGWQQYFLSFTADDDYDMIVIYAEPSTGSFQGSTYLHFLQPELLEIDKLIYELTQTPPTCQRILRACQITNAQYEWTNANGQVGTTSQISVNSSINPGDYTVSISVPGALNNPLLDNSCSDNNPVITKTVNIPFDCSCSATLQINNPSISYPKITIVGGSLNASYVTENLSSNCGINYLCSVDGGGEHFEFYGNSNQTNGNIWEARIVTVSPYTLNAGNTGTFNSVNIPFPFSGNYLTYSTSSNGYLDIEFPIHSNVFIIEVRLRNTILNEAKSIFIKNVPYSGISQTSFYCVNATAAFPNPHKIIMGVDKPGYSYLWALEQGMTALSSLTNCLMEFNDNQYNYGGNPNPEATLTTSNTHGCSSQQITIDITGSNCIVNPCSPPYSLASNLVLNAGTSSVSGTFTGFTNATHYLVVRSLNPTITFVPTYGDSYLPGQTFGSETIVSNSSTTSFTATGLTGNTNYYFFVFSVFFGNGVDCTGGPAYSANTLQGSQSTQRFSQSMVDTEGKSSEQLNNEVVDNKTVEIYPNPITSHITIKTSKPLEDISIVSLDGKVMYKHLAVGNRNTVSLQGLNQGHYFLKLLYKDKTLESKLIMKQ